MPTRADRETPPLRLRFGGRTSVSTLQDLPAVIERWNAVLSSFSLVTPGSNPRAGLLGMSGDRTLVIDVAVDAAVLAALQRSVEQLRASSEAATVLAGKIDELRALHVKADILKALEEEIRNNRYAAATQIADTIKVQSKCDQEAYKSLQKALVTLATFLEEGGEIECAGEAAVSHS